MSTFGDGTPLQALLDDVRGVQERYQLSDEQVNILVAHLLANLVDCYGVNKDLIQRKKDLYSGA